MAGYELPKLRVRVRNSPKPTDFARSPKPNVRCIFTVESPGYRIYFLTLNIAVKSSSYSNSKSFLNFKINSAICLSGLILPIKT